MKTNYNLKRKLQLISIIFLSLGISAIAQNKGTEKIGNSTANHSPTDSGIENKEVLNDSLKQSPRQWNNSINRWLNAPNWNPYYFRGMYDTHASTFINPYIPNEYNKRIIYDANGNKNVFTVNYNVGNNRKANPIKINSPRIKYKSLTASRSAVKQRSRPVSRPVRNVKNVSSREITSSNDNHSLRYNNASGIRSNSVSKTATKSRNNITRSFSSSKSSTKSSSRLRSSNNTSFGS